MPTGFVVHMRSTSVVHRLLRSRLLDMAACCNILAQLAKSPAGFDSGWSSLPSFSVFSRGSG